MTQTPSEFPKIIYAFWMQGRENAPEIVRICLDRWERLNPDYKMIILDKETAQPYMQGFSFDVNNLTVQTFSDILRLRLLRQTGGVWADATIYPTKPLDDWLAPHMAKHTFFALNSRFFNPAGSRDGAPCHPIASSFMAARPNCPLVEKWCDLVERYWFMERELMYIESPDKARPGLYLSEDIYNDMGLPDMRPTSHHPYFWLHHLFGYLLRHDSDFAAQWEATGYRDNKPHQTLQEKYKQLIPHPYPYGSKSFKRRVRWILRRLGFYPTETLDLHELLADAPFQKLTWQASYPLELLKNHPL